MYKAVGSVARVTWSRSSPEVTRMQGAEEDSRETLLGSGQSQGCGLHVFTEAHMLETFSKVCYCRLEEKP